MSPKGEWRRRCKVKGYLSLLFLGRKRTNYVFVDSGTELGEEEMLKIQGKEGMIN